MITVLIIATKIDPKISKGKFTPQNTLVKPSISPKIIKVTPAFLVSLKYVIINATESMKVT